MVLSTILGLLVDWTTFKRSRRRFPILCLTFLYCTFYPFFFLAIYPTIIADRLPTYNDRTYDMHFFYLTPVYVLIYYVNPPPLPPSLFGPAGLVFVNVSNYLLYVSFKNFLIFFGSKNPYILGKKYFALKSLFAIRENITIFLNKIADCTH